MILKREIIITFILIYWMFAALEEKTEVCFLAFRLLLSKPNNAISSITLGNDISPYEFKSLSSIFAFSVDGDLCNNYFSHGSQSGTITFQISMKEATAKAMQLVICKSF